jgi:acyl-CoA thioester hydrolase
MPDILEYPHTVREDELDVLGRADNRAYLNWMVEAALAHSAAQGWPVEAYLTLGSGWVVRSHTIEYLRPALPGERITVRTWVATVEAVSSARRYRVERASDNAVLATGETRWVFINFSTGRPTKIPPEIARAFPVVDAP